MVVVIEFSATSDVDEVSIVKKMAMKFILLCTQNASSIILFKIYLCIYVLKYCWFLHILETNEM